MEELIACLLKDKLRPPTVHCFLHLYSRATGIIEFEKILNLAKFFADFVLLVHQNSIFLPSTLAMCILRYSIRRLMSLGKCDEIKCQHLLRKLESTMVHSGLSEKEVSLCAKELHINL